ncbi:MAG TPA: hypothetical protein VGI12_01665 [Vicinamibacterales bacterium]|jgi:hypothetical protein
MLSRSLARLALLVLPVLTACFQSSTLVKLNPDGSGTIEQTTTISAQALSQLESFGTMGGKDKKDAGSDPFSIDEAKTAAPKMGEGVTFVSGDRIDTPDHKGLRAVYAFTDIRKLSLREMNAPAGADVGGKPSQPMSLAFAQLPNGHALLTIKNDTDLNKAGATAKTEAAGTPFGGMDQKQAMEMMKAMFAGMKIDFAIQVGHVVKTNVPYVSGGTVTLLSMDFDQVLSNPAALEQMEKAQSLDDARVALKGVKGIKVTLDPELTIEFTK